ncbi:hypothetical protein LINPERHAP2_LOCUS22819 [Linum perenne]
MMLGARSGIRNGEGSQFWSARWLDSGIILNNFAARDDPIFNQMDTISDFVSDSLYWDLDKLNRLLRAEIVEQVIGMSVPKVELGEDVWSWGYSHDGRFSIKSAYSLIDAQEAVGSDSF